MPIPSSRRRYGLRFLAAGAIMAVGACTPAAYHSSSSSANTGGRAEDSVYLYSYFHGDGDGLHLAASLDGYHWTALKHDSLFLTPMVGGKIMRDPCIRRGPDGVFRLVWTTGWGGTGFGYASSTDLVHWSEEQNVLVNDTISGVENTWAPELFYEPVRKRWMIVWSSTITGRNKGEQRPYYTTTADFKTFSAPKMLMDPGFSVIDGTIIQVGPTYHLILKEEYPETRTTTAVLRTTEAADPEGPYPPLSSPITKPLAEGPTAIRHHDGSWIIYYDHFWPPGREFVGAVRTTDWKHWTDISDQLSFPHDTRHGTVFRVPRSLVASLLESTPLAGAGR